jgi:hypothetical protein
MSKQLAIKFITAMGVCQGYRRLTRWRALIVLLGVLLVGFITAATVTVVTSVDQGTLQGSVSFDTATGLLTAGRGAAPRYLPLPGAVIALCGSSSVQAVADTHGDFTLGRLPDGAQTFQLSYPNYAASQFSYTIHPGRNVLAPLPARPLQQRKWTVLVYMSADNDLDHYAMDNIAEMEEAVLPSAAPDPDVTILVQLDRSSKNVGPHTWTETRRYRIVHHHNPTFLQSKRFYYPPLGETDLADPKRFMPAMFSPRMDYPPMAKQDMGNPTTLHDFIAWGQRTAPAEHYLVIAWGHGCGFILEDDALRTSTPPSSPANSLPAAAKSRAFCDDEAADTDGSGDNVTSINSAELSQALHGTQHVDILAMDACMMAMTEIAYEVRQGADYLVASEEEVPDRGCYYPDILGTLSRAHGNMTPCALACYFSAVDNRVWQHFGFNQITTSVVDLHRIQAVAQEMDKLARLLPTVKARDTRQLRQAHATRHEFGMVTDYINPSRIIDLWDYLHQLATTINDPAVRRQAATCERAVLACVIANYTSPRCAFAHGLSIYVPPSTEWKKDSVETYGAFAFCQDTAWGKWLAQNP